MYAFNYNDYLIIFPWVDWFVNYSLYEWEAQVPGAISQPAFLSQWEIQASAIR